LIFLLQTISELFQLNQERPVTADKDNNDFINKRNILLIPRLVANGFNVVRFHSIENSNLEREHIEDENGKIPTSNTEEVFDTVCNLIDNYYSRLQQRLEYENLYARCQKILNVVQQRADKVLFEFQNKQLESK